jgi:uncharacterized sulfatase
MIKLFKKYTIYFFAIAIAFMLIRLIEYYWFQSIANIEVPWDMFWSKSVNLDLIFLGIIFSAFLPIYMVLKRVNEVLANSILLLFSTILLCFQIVLTHYHITNRILLDSVVLNFSLDELLKIAGAEFSWINISIIGIWLLVLIIFTGVINGLQRLQARKLQFGLFIFFIALCLNAFININYSFKTRQKFDSRIAYFISNNKSIYLLKSISHLKQSKTDMDITKAINDYQSLNPDRKYVSNLYPLVYSRNAKKENVLGSYFTKTDIKPNIVFVISESLSSLYSVDALGLEGNSITPFTDSLASMGLYWEYFLSNANRSFGVLPNVLASLPPSDNERGFINNTVENRSFYPHHLSLINDLKRNNYQSFHFYPGWGDFDHTRGYMKYLGLDTFLDFKDFDTTKYEMYGQWGYNDKDLYSTGLDFIQENSDKPFVALFQTIAYHSPYDLLNPESYSKKYLDEKLKEIGLDRKQLDSYTDRQLATIFSCDDALKYLVNRFKKMNGYDKTIFVVTGDHGNGGDKTNHKFLFNHVPLIIYSPLLQKSARFKGLSSHIDILPSVQALLEDNFHMKIERLSSAIGYGLDTSLVFRSKNLVPLQIHSMENPNFIYQDVLLENGLGFQLKDDLLTESVKDSEKIKEAENVFSVFKAINTYTVKKDQIMVH